MPPERAPRGTNGRSRPPDRLDWTAWADLMEAIEQARDALDFQPGEECFYRGHGDSRYALLPTLLRLGLDDARMRDVESDLFFEFQARARDLHGQGLSDWDYLFYMRHHGLPTRILDWTESLASALYFALRSAPRGKRQPCIWLLNPYALNADEWGRDLVVPRNLGWDDDEQEFYDYGELLLEAEGIYWESPVAIYPLQRNARMAAQRGWFTIHGTDNRPLDKIDRGAVRQVPIPADAAAAASALLVQMGIDSFALFNDLDSLAESLAEKNNLGAKR